MYIIRIINQLIGFDTEDTHFSFYLSCFHRTLFSSTLLVGISKKKKTKISTIPIVRNERSKFVDERRKKKMILFQKEKEKKRFEFTQFIYIKH